MPVLTGARMVQCWEHSSPTNVTGVQILALMPYVSVNLLLVLSLLWEVFLWVLQFSPLLKNPCSERFSSGYSSFPLSSKTNISKVQFDQESGGWRTTWWMCYVLIVIYLFVYYLPTSQNSRGWSWLDEFGSRCCLQCCCSHTLWIWCPSSVYKRVQKVPKTVCSIWWQLWTWSKATWISVEGLVQVKTFFVG